MAERHYRLTERQVNELIAAYAQSTAGPTRTRLLAVRLYGTGYSVTEICEITRCSRTSLMEWCQKYLEQGSGGLADHRLGGNSRKLTREQVVDLKERLHQYSPRAVFGSDTATAEGRFWTVEDLQRAIQHWYGVHYQSRTSCLTLFARCGFSYQRPARVFKSRREADVAAFEETVEKNS
jgi:transposase